MKSKWGASVQSFSAASLWPTERRRSSRSVLSSNCRSPLSPARNVAPVGAIKAINSVLFYSLLIHFSKEDSPVVTLLLCVARINNGFDCVYWPFDGPTPESNFGFYTLQLFCQVWKQFHSFLSPISLTVSVWVTQYLQFFFIFQRWIVLPVVLQVQWAGKIFCFSRGTSLPFSLLPVDDTSKIYNNWIIRATESRENKFLANGKHT